MWIYAQTESKWFGCLDSMDFPSRLTKRVPRGEVPRLRELPLHCRALLLPRLALLRVALRALGDRGEVPGGPGLNVFSVRFKSVSRLLIAFQQF